MTDQRTADAIDPYRLYTYAEIAEFFGVAERRVRRWVEEGKLDYTPLPGGGAGNSKRTHGRRVSGAQYLAYVEKAAVAAEA